VLLLSALFIMALALGCGEKAEKETEKVPVEVKEAEQADTTRLDAAESDTTGEAEQAPDSL
jgi:hypothetical protein